MTRANVTWALLFVSFQLFSQQSSRTIDELFQSALKVGRSDAKKVARVIDSLEMLKMNLLSSQTKFELATLFEMGHRISILLSRTQEIFIKH